MFEVAVLWIRLTYYSVQNVRLETIDKNTNIYQGTGVLLHKINNRDYVTNAHFFCLINMHWRRYKFNNRRWNQEVLMGISYVQKDSRLYALGENAVTHEVIKESWIVVLRSTVCALKIWNLVDIELYYVLFTIALYLFYYVLNHVPCLPCGRAVTLQLSNFQNLFALIFDK